MYKTIKKEVIRIEEEHIPVCDFCGKETEHSYGGCPSERPISSLFVGYLETSGYSPSMEMVQSKYGLDLGDVCRECRENWFKDLQDRYPNAKVVKFND